jgi:hypothetical protein
MPVPAMAPEMNPRRRSHPVKHRLSYASVTATLALLLAVGGTTAVGAQALLTGRNVKDESLTGADVENDSLTGADIRAGSLGSNLFSTIARANLRGQTGATGAKGDTGAAGPQGPAGLGITASRVSGDDVTDYQNLTPLATTTLAGSGDYVIFAHVAAHNTGAADDSINCGLFINDDFNNAVGGGGAQVTIGATVDVSAVGALSLTAPVKVTLACYLSGGTTYDLSNVEMRVHNLG